MKDLVQRIIACFVLTAFFSNIVFAQRRGTRPDIKNFYDISNAPSGQTQYAFKPVDERNLIPVRVMGEINKPGVHYVPRNANLLDLLGLAGGPTTEAEVSKISIRTVRSGKDEVIKVDGDDLFGNTKKPLAAPSLFPNDVVYIPTDEPMISDDAARIVTVLGALASMVLSIVIVRRELQGK